MKTLDQIIGDVLVREGWPKFTDRPSDKGGPTKGGVTLANYNAWRVKSGRPPITLQQLKDLPDADAREFLTDEFTRPFVFITDEAIRVFLIDWAVTSGPDDPTLALQRALALHGLYAGALDGIGGAKTRAAWASVAGDFTLCAQIEAQLFRARAQFYMDCALAGPDIAAFLKSHPDSQLHNLRGWINRTLEFA